MRRVPILAKLLGAYLVPTVALFAGFGLLAHRVARRALAVELGRRLTAVAATVAADIGDESVALLQPGDESTRTYRNLSRRLGELQAASGVARVYLFAADRTSRCDTRAGVPIGQRYYALDAWQSELGRVFAGTPTASLLFRGQDGALYESGFAPLSGSFAVGVDGAASLYDELGGLRRALLWLGLASALVVLLLSLGMARLLVRPVELLARAAARIGRGHLDEPVALRTRDEIGVVAETMEEMRAQLRARDERMQMMLAGIAHEVRNPLAGIELYAGLLRDDLGGDAARAGERGHVERIERELGRLGTIVNEFLDYARRPPPRLGACDLGALVAEVHELCAPQARARGVALRLEVAAAEVRADAGQLRRALLNLGRNAVEACSDDGSGVVVLGCGRDGGGPRVTVRDNGPGIAPEAQARIFTPFYTTKQSGTGLGLAFVHDIARDHGARVEVRCDGEGTTFTFAFSESGTWPTS